MASTTNGRNTLLAGVAIGTTCSLALVWLLSPTITSKFTTRQSTSSRSITKGDDNIHKTNNNNDNPKTIPQELREEQLSRHTLYFGDNGMQSIRNSKVCIVGLGGVGSHTAVMLARGGVEHLRLIDFDQVTLSSLNRHACATLKDVGIPKVICVQKFCQALGVQNIDAKVEMYTAQSGPMLLGHDNQQQQQQQWDVVIDCIDDVPTKAALLAYCIEHKIRVLSCMGAGGKSDMTRLHISDLRTAAKDPLASKLRQTLKRLTKDNPAFQQQQSSSNNDDNDDNDSGTATDKKSSGSDSYLDDMNQLTIIYSSEKTVAKLADLTEEQKQQGDKSQFGAVDGMRIRVLPVLGPIPAIMGQSLAAMALCELGKKPILQPVTGERLGRTVRHRKFQHLKRREEQLNAAAAASSNTTGVDNSYYRGPIEIDIDDIEYLMGVWRNCCAVTGARLGTVLEFVRWNVSLPARPDNLVLMSGHAIKAFDETGKSSIPEDIQKRIETRLEAVREQSGQVF